LDAPTAGFVIMGRRMTPLATLVPAEKRITASTVAVARVSYSTLAALHGRGRQSAQRPGSMTVRQREVLQLIAEGNRNKQVAAIVGTSIKTVEKHRQNLMDTLGIHDIAGLTRFAIAHGVVEADTGSGLAGKRTA